MADLAETSWKDWYKAHKDTITFSAVATVIVVVGAGLYVQYRKDRGTEAQELFSQAQNLLRRPPASTGDNSSQAQAVQLITRLGSEFKDMEISRPAALYEAEILRAKGQYPQALERVREFLQTGEGKKDVWMALAKRNQAYYLELSGNYAQAGQSFMSLAEEKQPWLAREELQLGQARCLLALGKKDEAHSLLKPIAEARPASYWSRSADAMLNM